MRSQLCAQDTQAQLVVKFTVPLDHEQTCKARAALLLGPFLQQKGARQHCSEAASKLSFSINRRAVALAVIVKASSGPRYVVGCRSKVDKSKLVSGTRVALDMTTLTIMRFLPREACSQLGFRFKFRFCTQLAAHDAVPAAGS